MSSLASFPLLLLHISFCVSSSSSLPRFPAPLFHLTNYGTPGLLAPLSPSSSLPALLLLPRCLSSSSFAFTHPLGPLPPFSPPLFFVPASSPLKNGPSRTSLGDEVRQLSRQLKMPITNCTMFTIYEGGLKKYVVTCTRL